MNRIFLLAFAVCALSLSTGCSREGGVPTGPALAGPQVTSATWLDASGGVVESDGCRVIIPAGALSEAHALSLTFDGGTYRIEPETVSIQGQFEVWIQHDSPAASLGAQIRGINPATGDGTVSGGTIDNGWIKGELDGEYKAFLVWTDLN